MSAPSITSPSTDESKSSISVIEEMKSEAQDGQTSEPQSEVDDAARFRERESRMEVMTDDLLVELANPSLLDRTNNWISTNAFAQEKRRRYSSEPMMTSNHFYWDAEDLLAASQNRRESGNRTKYTDKVLEQVQLCYAV